MGNSKRKANIKIHGAFIAIENNGRDVIFFVDEEMVYIFAFLILLTKDLI
ncbi:MAG: hypothetical protein GX185_08525 [Tissierellia bacterium]|nr:hypothetical protein [Tissierellia bacterium]